MNTNTEPTEKVNTVTGEVIQELVVPDAMLALVKEADKAVYQALNNVNSLDWRSLKPNEMALILTQKPFAVSGGGTMFLNFKQALLFALRCYELGVSPLSSEVWYDPNRASTNLTLEGKRMVARNRGIDLGPPSFVELEREWSTLPKMSENATAAKNAGFAKDVGAKCKIRVGPIANQEYSEYSCWLSEWYVPKSPVWQSRTMHMIQTMHMMSIVT